MCQASPVVVYSSELATQGCGLDEDQAQHWLSIKKTQQRATTSQKCKCKCFKNKCHVSKQAIYCLSVKLQTKEQRNRQIMLIDHFGQVTTRNCRYLASVRIFQYYFDRDT